MISSAVLDEWLASGRAKFGTFTSNGGMNVLTIPNKSVVFITGITLRAFADLAPATSFGNYRHVAPYLAHQVRLLGKKGQLQWVFFHDVRAIQTDIAGAWLYLPVGEHKRSCWFATDNDVSIEITHMPTSGYTVSQDRIENKGIVSPNPPYGYGHSPSGQVALQYTTNVGMQFESKPRGSKTTSVQPTSYDGFEWPVNAQTRLNAPMIGSIDFGYLTMPLITVDYIVINKAADATLRGAAGR